MLKNYLKVAIRNLIRNKTYVFINVLGLSVAIAVCIVIYLNFRHTMDANKEHPDYTEIFKINGKRVLNGNPQGVGITPLPLTTLMDQDISGIKHSSRFHKKGEVVKVGDIVFRETLAYVDRDFFQLFDFPIIEGSVETTDVQNAITISEDLAIRLFDEASPIGEEVRVVSNGKEFLYTVNAVVGQIPTNSSFFFDAILPFDNYFRHYPAVTRSDWSQWVDGSFVQLENASDKDDIEGHLSNYLALQNEANDHLTFSEFYLERIDEWAHSERLLFHGRFKSGMAPSAVWGLNSSAILILILSCFNFTNTSISFSNKRLKEIGIRKVFGGVRSQLITQFLIENFILIILALVVGLVLAEMLIPAFNNLFWFIHIELNLIENFNLLSFLIILMVIVGAFSAVYPSVYVSSFKPVNIFRGKTRFGAGNRFLKVLIAGQFIITVYNIFGGIVFYQNGRYQMSMDQGYDMHNSIVVPINGESDFNTLKNVLVQDSEISSISGSHTQLAFSNTFTTLKHEESEFAVSWLQIGHDYLKTMGIALKEGRDFDIDIDTYSSKKILVNEELIKDLGWNYPEGAAVGKRLFLDSAYYTVIGIVRNFHEQFIFKGGDIKPALITLTDPQNFRFLTVRTENEDLSPLDATIREEWVKIFPFTPYDGYYQSRAIEVVGDTNYIIDRVNIFVVIISVLLSGIGLYTLVSLNIIKRIKEIGIRKVLGASVLNIIGILNRNFTGLLFIGAIVGSISGYFVLDWLLSIIYAYRLPIDLWPMVFSIMLLVVIAAATVGSKVYNAASINPIDHLRNE